MDCAARGGDQLALYLRGKRRIEAPTETSMLVQGLVDLVASADEKENVPAVCADIVQQQNYECSTGLPEAHYLLGILLSNCRSQLYWPDLARFHLLQAQRNGIWSANRAFLDLEHQTAQPMLAACSVTR